MGVVNPLSQAALHPPSYRLKSIYEILKKHECGWDGMITLEPDAPSDLIYPQEVTSFIPKRLNLQPSTPKITSDLIYPQEVLNPQPSTLNPEPCT